MVILKNDLYRDFTYIDDIVEGIQRLLSNPPKGDVEHKVFNIGNNNPEKTNGVYRKHWRKY